MFKNFNVILLSLALFACSDDKAADVPAVFNTHGASTEESLIAEKTTPSSFQEGVHYRVLEKPLTETSVDGKITVTEFFWYGCSHCRSFEPALHAWNKNQPDTVLFNASPAVWSQPMELHAMAYFIAQTVLMPDELHARLFDTIMGLQGEKDLEKHKATLAKLFSEFGLAEKDFNTLIYSTDMESHVKNAIAIMKQVKVNGTPTILVNGKYVVINKSIKTYDEILAITDFLIKKELTPGI